MPARSARPYSPSAPGFTCGVQQNVPAQQRPPHPPKNIVSRQHVHAAMQRVFTNSSRQPLASLTCGVQQHVNVAVAVRLGLHLEGIVLQQC